MDALELERKKWKSREDAIRVSLMMATGWNLKVDLFPGFASINIKVRKDFKIDNCDWIVNYLPQIIKKHSLTVASLYHGKEKYATVSNLKYYP